MDERTGGITLVDVLRRRAAESPDRIAYTFLVDGEEIETSLTYLELEVWARRIAVALAARHLEGRTALLVCDPGLDFVAGLFGCFLAGVVAVPVYPPDPRAMAVGLGRLEQIGADADAAVVLTTAGVRERTESWLRGAPILRALEWCSVETMHVGSEVAWRDRGVGRDGIAFLQYTSGSTGSPKGVMVTHGNIMAHGASVSAALGLEASAVVVSWLPLYHDMGLIGSVLIPLQVGCRSVQVSPLDFLERPVRWLRAISRYRGTLSPAPNFAFDLVVRRTSEADRHGLDLRSWAAAMNGAEPVRAETCDRFVAAFAPYGFRRAAFVPCYGLAEATLMVSGGPAGSLDVISVDGAALARHRVVDMPVGAAGARTIVGCGRVTPGLEVVIADAETRAEVGPGEIGEILVAGGHVAAGYWHRPEDTAAVFAGRLANPSRGPFLRTGDLGFVRDATVFVTGRLKDLLIVRGRNLYPQDLEQTAALAHPSLRPGGGAAFAVDAGSGDERIVVVHESNAACADEAVAAADAIARALASEYDVRPQAIVLIPPRTLPKTSSGKVRRRACRDAYVSATLETLQFPESSPPEAPVTAPVDAVAIEAWLVGIISELRRLPPERIRRDDVLMALGIDSAEAAEVAAALGDRLGRPVPLRLVFEHPTIASLAERLSEVAA
ncbi:MAG: AMP-binding protein [Candidatus Binatia bacterium]